MYLIGFYSKKKLYKLINFYYYKNAFLALQKEGIKIIYFYKEDVEIKLEQNLLRDINRMGIEIFSFSDDNEIVSYVSKLKGKVFINTFEEQEIRLANKIRQKLGQKITDNPEIFLDKSLQRKAVIEKYPELVVKYKLLSIDNINKLTDKDLLDFPFIIKPNGGVQSSGVLKINNYKDYCSKLHNTLDSLKELKNKNLNNNEILLEEFIDGNMYTTTYYVNEDQKIFYSKPVQVKSGFDYGIEDFCNVVRIISKDVEDLINEDKLTDFIKKTVLSCNIRNTFIHHDFKINSKGEFKTIETNGRIGGYRLNMYQLGYKMNLLMLPFIESGTKYNIKNNVATFVLYPKKDGLFDGFNENLIDEISKLTSFYKIYKIKINIGDKIGLTKNGHEKLGSIVLINKDISKFKEDVAWLERIYFDIIKLK